MQPMPLAPMLLTSQEKPHSSSDYLYEWKVDGIRCLAYINDGSVRLFSRHGLECTNAFPELQGIAERVDARAAVLDGELCTMVGGKPDLEAVMERYMTAKPQMIESGAKQLPANLIVWDVLEKDSQILTHESLIERKGVLDGLVAPNPHLHIIDSIDGQGEALFEAICAQGLEGIVAKRKDSRYKVGERSKNWIKIKNWRHAECLILGYRLHEPGLILGITDGSRLRSVGVAEHGLKAADWEALRAVSREIETGRDKHTVWLRPMIKCLVRHVGVTSKKNLRDMFFQRFVV